MEEGEERRQWVQIFQDAVLPETHRPRPQPSAVPTQTHSAWHACSFAEISEEVEGLIGSEADVQEKRQKGHKGDISAPLPCPFQHPPTHIKRKNRRMREGSVLSQGIESEEGSSVISIPFFRAGRPPSALGFHEEFSVLMLFPTSSSDLWLRLGT